MLNSSKSTSISLENCYERQLDKHMPRPFHNRTQKLRFLDMVYILSRYTHTHFFNQFYLYGLESPACKKTYTVIFHIHIDIKLSCGRISNYLFLKSYH